MGQTQTRSKRYDRRRAVNLGPIRTQSVGRQHEIIRTNSWDSENRQSENKQPESSDLESRHTERRKSKSRQSENKQPDSSDSESWHIESSDSESIDSDSLHSERRDSERRQSESKQPESSDSEIRQPENKHSESRDLKSRQSDSKQLERKQSESNIIVAIDFGTTYTGFAYVFNGNVTKVFTGKSGNVLKDHRVPTVLLPSHKEDKLYFGVDAEDHYARLVFDNQHHEYRLFRQFKMALYTQKDTLNKELTINDTMGRSKKAIDVFSIIIKHLKELVFKSMKNSINGKTSKYECEIQWMLTIPAIWSDSARQFMREAAIQGGIPEKNLRLVLEPEAAALFCKNDLLHITHNGELRNLPPGMKYIMADLGGGTADICSHEILEDGNIRELYRVQGGPYGGSSVNNYFIQFLIKMFGADIFKQFEGKKMMDYLRIMREFEESKKKCEKKQTTELLIEIPQSLVKMLEEDTGCTLREMVANSEFSKFVTVEDNHLLCDKIIMDSFFEFSVDSIVQTLRDIISHCEKDKIDILLLVGGYSESQYVRGIIKKEINQLKVVLVQEPSLAVLKGALYMALEPRNIIERRARYTYGFSVARPFKEGTHPESLKFTRDGNIYCSEIFYRVIEKDQILTYNQEFKVNTNTKLRQPDSKRLKLSTALYRSDKREPEYCLETENCLQVGNIVLEPPVDGWPDHLEMDDILVVGETEFTVKARDKSSGKEYKTYVDFL